MIYSIETNASLINTDEERIGCMYLKRKEIQPLTQVECLYREYITNAEQSITEEEIVEGLYAERKEIPSTVTVCITHPYTALTNTDREIVECQY